MTRHAFIYFLVRAGNGLLAFATLAVFTRMLSPEGYGLYSLIMAASTITATVLFQWQNVSVARYFHAYDSDLQKLLIAANSGFWAAAGVTILLVITVVLVYPWKGIDPFMLVLLCLLAISSGRHNLHLQLANISGNTMRYAMLSWVRGGVALMIAIGLIWRGAKAHGALLGTLLGLGVAIFFVSPLKNYRIPWRLGERGIARELFKYGFPLTFTFIAISVVDMADRLMIGWLTGVKAVGSYGAPYDFTQLLIGPCINVLFLAGFPRAVTALEKDGEAVACKYLKEMGQAMLIIGLPLTLLVAMLAHDIAGVIFGAGIRVEAARIMPWVAFAIFIGGMKSYYLDTVFQIRKNTKTMAYIAVSMAIINILMNLVLLPPFGALGAAWATLGAFAIGAIVSYRMGKPQMDLGMPWHLLRGVTLACTPMVLVLMGMTRWSGSGWLVIKVCLGLAMYLGVCWWVDLGDSRAKLGAFFLICKKMRRLSNV